MITLKEDAIFIADSHYNHNNTILEAILKDIEAKHIKCSQLFLVGDIFDFLSDEISYFKITNNKMIDLINDISFHAQVIYLEGNHDFNLKNIFPNSTIIPRNQQPFTIKSNDKEILLSHGDIYMPITYSIYTKIIRNHFLLKFLNSIDINYWLTYRISNYLSKKEICKEYKDFKEFTTLRKELYDTDKFIIEGHHHQGYQDDKYINIPSLVCSKQYLIFKENRFNFVST